MSTDRDLNQGPVSRALISVSAPMTLGILGVLSVGLADAIFLARHSDAALAAIGFIYPVIVALVSLSIGLSAGTNTVVSQAIGKGERGATRQRLTLHAMGLAATMACTLSLLFYLVAPWLFSLMGAKGDVLEAVLGYVPYWCLSFPPMVTGMALNATFRAAGRSGVAATTMAFQACLNIALDPVFIFGVAGLPELGAEGAGLATFLARGLAFTGLFTFAVYQGVITLDCAPLKDLRKSVRRILRVGLPAALSNAINPAGMAAVTAAVAVIGDAAVAGFGAALRVQSILFVPMLALSSGIGPVVGQAWGADRQDRARDAMRLSVLFCLGYGLTLAMALLIFATPIAKLMTGGDGVAPYTAQYLRVVGWGLFGYGILITANAAMNARDRALWSMALSAARIALIFIPFAWLGVWTLGYSGVLLAALAANVIGAWAALVATRATGLSHLDWWPVRLPAVRLARALPPRPN
jgi:putative MATE family efflux protein